MAEAKWTQRFSRLSQRMAIGAIVVAGAGLVLARYDIVPKLAGFSALLGGGLLAVVAALAGLAGLILNLRHPTATRRAAIIGLILSLPFAGFLISRPMASHGAPALHDLSTDLANPPAFTRLTLRADNMAGVGTVENWRAIHARAYPDLKPVVIARPPATVLADAERLARAQGWEIALSDPAAGQLEATATVSFIRFHDDVILRVKPAADGKSSVVDMRSVSRIGVGDLGVNAKRIRAFLKSLA